VYVQPQQSFHSGTPAQLTCAATGAGADRRADPHTTTAAIIFLKEASAQRCSYLYMVRRLVL